MADGGTWVGQSQIRVLLSASPSKEKEEKVGGRRRVQVGGSYRPTFSHVPGTLCLFSSSPRERDLFLFCTVLHRLAVPGPSRGRN